MSDTIRVYVIDDASRNNLRLRYIDPNTGKAHHRSARTDDHAEALRAAGVWQAELNAGIKSKSRGRLAWKEFVEICTTERIAALAPRTRPLYRAILDSLTEVIHPATVGSVTAQAISRWQAHQRKECCAEATIESRAGMLRALLNWAVDQGYLQECPKFAKLVRSRTGTRMKGRPISQAELELMLAKVPGVVEKEHAADWIRSLRGLWLGGLRLSEAIDLSWDEPGRLRADMSSPVPCLRILGDREKGMEDRLLPIAPEFGRWLLETPGTDRHGPVFGFPLQRKRVCKSDPGRPSMPWISKLISDIGEAAGIVVNESPVKFASAHDLRRSFAETWIRRKVSPATLMELMRHTSIETTMEFYREQNSRRTGEDLWKEFGNLGPTFGPTEPPESPSA